MGDPVSTQTLSDLVTGPAPAAPPKVKVSAIRAQYPMYNDMSDDQLLIALHRKLYPDMNARQFYGGIDYDTDRAKADPTADMGAGARLVAGYGKAGSDLVGGIERLGNMVGIGNYDQKAAQEDARIDAPLMNTTAGKVGNFAGNVALTALPVGGATGAVTRGATAAARVLPQALQATARFIAPTAAAAATGAATGALSNPQDMTQGAEMGAIGGAGGDLVGRGLTRVAGGMLAGGVTPEARALMDQGVNVPIWKAQNGFIRTAGESLKKFPLVGDLMRNAEGRAGQQWNRNLMRDATPGAPVMDDAGNVIRWDTSAPVTAVGQDGMQQVGARFRDAYGAIYGNRAIPVPQGLNDELEGIVQNTRAYNPGVADDVAGAAREAGDALNRAVAPTVTTASTGGGSVGSGRISGNMRTPVQTTTTTELGHAGAAPQDFANAIGSLDARISDAWRDGNGTLGRQLQAMRDAIANAREQGLPPEVQSMLQPVNQAYGNFKTLQRAASGLGAMRNDGVVSPQQMLNAVRAGDTTAGKSASAQGTARGQQAAQDAYKVFGSRLPEVGPGTSEAMLLGGLGTAGGFTGTLIPALGGAALFSAPGQRAMQGGYAWQAMVRAHPELAAQILRTGGNAFEDTK